MVVAGLTTIAVVAAGAITPWSPPAARADELRDWPSVEVWIDPSFVSVEGLVVMDQHPSFGFSTEDDGAGPFDDYDVEFRVVEAAASSQIVVSDTVTLDRYGNYSYGYWSPEDPLARGVPYEV